MGEGRGIYSVAMFQAQAALVMSVQMLQKLG